MPIKDDVKSAIRYLKSTGSEFSLSEICNLSGMAQRSTQRNKDELKRYWRLAEAPSQEEITYYSDRGLDVLLSKATSPKEALGIVCGYLLRYRYGLLGHIRKNTKIAGAGQDVIDVMLQILSRKDAEKGVGIHSKHGAARRLLDNNKVAFVDVLFTRSDSYRNGNTSKLWKMSEDANQLLSDTIHVVLDKWHIMSGTYNSLYVYELIRHFHRISRKEIGRLSLPSILHILNSSVGMSQDGMLLVEFKHSASTQEEFGRSYNAFTRLRSLERLKLGYNGYDMNAAMQSITLHMIDAGASKYPLLWRYVHEPDYKRYVRSQIASDLGIEEKKVKQKLTAFSNGGCSGKDEHPLYAQFQKESDQLRREVLAYVEVHESGLLQRAIAQSKRQIPEELNWQDITSTEEQSMARDKASVFFFVWTWYERLIRLAMLKVIPNGIEVHDAVYSKADVDVKLIEEIILKETGFPIRIEKEMADQS